MLFPALHESVGLKSVSGGTVTCNVFFWWPFGAENIECSGDGAIVAAYRNLFLQLNPLTWSVVLTAVFLAAIVFVVAIFSSKKRLKHAPMIGTLLVLFLAHAALVPSQAEPGDMLVPFMLGLLLLALLLTGAGQLFGTQGYALSNSFLPFLVIPAVGLSVYYLSFPYEDSFGWQTFKMRVGETPTALIWDTSEESDINEDTSAKSFARLILTGLKPGSSYQSWGVPHFGLSVSGKPVAVQGKPYKNVFGVHANSLLTYHLDGRYQTFGALAALPDYLEGYQASVVFEIVADGKPLWQSELVNPGSAPQRVEVSISGVDVLELKVKDGGDGINYDHACWIDPELS
jgi:hypothetical protein